MRHGRNRRGSDDDSYEDSDEDEVIDLTDRLAPYDGSALRPVAPTASEPMDLDQPVWRPFEFDFPYQTTESPQG